MTSPSSALSTDGDRETSVSRRAMLAATAGLTVSSGGCVRQVRSAVNRDGLDRLSMTITTVPADGDRESILLARAIRDALETAGIDVSIEMRSEEEFLRSILINHEFDVYVGRHPADTDPAYLYETLHSRYADEAGWQNPFGFANLAVDERLEAQRRADGDDRRAAVAETLEAFATHQPFVPICVPDEYRIARTDRFGGWGERHPATKLGYLGLETDGSGAGADADGPVELRAAHTDARPSQNLNPLAVEYRDRGTVVDLLYDSLAVEPVAEFETEDADDGDEIEPDADLDGEGEDSDDETADDGADADADGPVTDLEPWLAESWEWTETGSDGGDAATLTVSLREDCRFHDGEPVTADDVAFTYRFLADTTLDEGVVPAPSPRHRGRVDAVDAVDVVDEHRLEFSVGTSRTVGERALTVPVLPEHVWRERSAAADVPGVRIAEGTTEALVADNVPPIGSGPFRFESRTDREHVTLERFDDHFTLREGVDRPAPTVDRFRIQIDPRSTSAIALVEGDDADVTTTTLETYVIDDVLEGTPEDVTVLESRSWSFYHLGFNARKAPFSNPRFRRVVARLFDKERLVEEVFHGHARPLATPVTEEWTPDALAWEGDDPATPFLGADGEVDAAAARAAFEEAGFSYDSEGRLRVRE